MERETEAGRPMERVGLASTPAPALPALHSGDRLTLPHSALGRPGYRLRKRAVAAPAAVPQIVTVTEEQVPWDSGCPAPKVPSDLEFPSPKACAGPRGGHGARAQGGPLSTLPRRSPGPAG